MAEPSGEKVQPANEKSGKSEKRRNWWVIPVVTSVCIAAIFAVAYLAYVPARREYLANRNFRALAVLGDQVQELISIHGSILEFAADLAEPTRNPKRRRKEDLNQFLVLRPEDENLKEPERSSETRKDYLKYLAPNFELTEKRASEHPGKQSRLEVKRNNGTWQLMFTAERHPGSKWDYIGTLDLNTILNPFAASLPFDDLFLVSEQGTIVYQRDRLGPQFTTLAGLLEAQSGTEAKAPEKPEAKHEEAAGDSSKVSANSDPRWKDRSMHLTEITLAGTRYKLFLQPVLVDVYTDDPREGEAPREWILCGLKSSRVLEWEALSISSTLVIWLTAIFLIVGMSGPVLKVFFLNHRERLRFADLGTLGLFLVLLTGVVTLVGLQAAGFPLNDDTDRQLTRLGNKLSQNIHDDLRDMRNQLVAWCRTPALRDDMKAAGGREVIRKAPGDWQNMPGAHVRATPKAEFYPHFSNVFWTDDDGQQIVKWSASGNLTPLIDVSRQRLFIHPKTVYIDAQGPPFYFGSVMPPNKVEYLSVMSLKTEDCAPGLKSSGVSEDLAHGFVALSAQPLSLIDPIMPFGYGFALLDETGNVVFHANKTRNLHENFLRETDWNKELYSAEFGHSAPLSMRLTYMGKDYRARVLPIRGLSQAPWSLVVFRDLDTVRTLNLQAMTIASSLFLTILFLPVLCIGLWCLVHRLRFPPEWLWPNQARMGTYISLIVIHSVLILVFAAAGFTGPVEENLAACVVVPYAALILTVWCFRTHRTHTGRLTGGRVTKGVARGHGKLLTTPAMLALLAGVIFFSAAQVQMRTFSGWPVVMGFAFLGAIPALERPGRYIFLKKVRTWRFHAQAAVKPTARPALRTSSNESAKCPWRTCYMIAILLPLLLVGVLTPIALFRACVNIERRLETKQTELHLATALNQRLLKVELACESGELGQAACEELRKKGTGAWTKIAADPLFPEDGNIPAVSHSTLAPGDEYFHPWLRHLIALLHHDFNDTSAEMSGMISDRRTRNSADEPDWYWQNEKEGGKTRVALLWHGVHFLSSDMENPENDLIIRSDVPEFSAAQIATGVGVAGMVTLVMSLIVWAIARKIFLFPIDPLRITGERQALDAVRDGLNVVVLLPPLGHWKFEEPKHTLHLPGLMTTPNWAETMDLSTLPYHVLIELDHFEYETGDANLDGQKCILLDRLLKRENTQTGVILNVPASSEDYRRLFPTMEVADLREEPFYWLERYELRARDPIWRDLIWKECGPLPALWPLGAQLAHDLRHNDEHSSETVAAEILERADAYYKLIWKECTPDQRFVLAQFAEDGLLNPTNLRPIRQLVRRGLIVTDPQFRLMNESFRRFLRSVAPGQLKKQWRREARQSGWGKMHGAFFATMVLLGLFLLTTQNALWQSSAAYVTTLLGALGTASKLFTAFRTGSVAEKAD